MTDDTATDTISISKKQLQQPPPTPTPLQLPRQATTLASSRTAIITNDDTPNYESVSYKEKIIGWAEKSSFHGIPQITGSKNYLVKLVWLGCLVASSYLCGKTVVTNLIDYFSYSVDTVVQLDRDSNVNFPAVTICRLQICGLDGNEYSRFVDEFLARENAKKNLSTSEANVTQLLDAFRMYFLSKYNQSQLNSILDTSAVASSIEQDLIACLYDGVECTPDDFVDFQLDEFQTCYTFNSGRNSSSSGRQDVKPRKVRRFGKNYGLHLELFLGLPEDCKTPLSRNYGLVVYVHNSTYSVWDETNGFEIMSGYETDVAVERTRLLKLPAPFSDCIVNTDPAPSDASQSVLDTYLVASFYTQQTCLQLCYQSYLAEHDSCFDPSLPYANRSRLKPCNEGKNLTNLYFSDRTKFYQEKYADCLDDCPLECESYTYKATLSTTEFPSPSYAELLAVKKNVSVELTRPENNIVGDEKNLWRNGFVSMNVYYKSQTITVITERPQTEAEEFISELGGTLGLFLGISFLSFVELIEIVLELIVLHVEKRRARKIAARAQIINVIGKDLKNLGGETQA